MSGSAEVPYVCAFTPDGHKNFGKSDSLSSDVGMLLNALAAISLAFDKTPDRIGEAEEGFALLKRLQAHRGRSWESTERLREKREREVKVKGFLEKVELAYAPEGILGGSARDCIQCYYGAVANGYVLNDEDRRRIKHCYDVGLLDLKDQRRYFDNQIRMGVTPIRNPKDIDNDIKQLNRWYNALRK